jgi:hypothetical protein
LQVRNKFSEMKLDLGIQWSFMKTLPHGPDGNKYLCTQIYHAKSVQLDWTLYAHYIFTQADLTRYLFSFLYLTLFSS